MQSTMLLKVVCLLNQTHYFSIRDITWTIPFPKEKNYYKTCRLMLVFKLDFLIFLLQRNNSQKYSSENFNVFYNWQNENSPFLFIQFHPFPLGNIWSGSGCKVYGERAAESYSKTDKLFVQTGCLSNKVCLITDIQAGECDGRWLMHDLHICFSFCMVNQQLFSVRK